MRFAAEGNESTLFWADDGVVYAVVTTGADRGRLNQIAQAVYDQMEKKT
jgi:anti-sigma factor RsiW